MGRNSESRVLRVLNRYSSVMDRFTGQRLKSRRCLQIQLELIESRQLLTLPPTLTIPLMPELDQFGDQILIVQGFDDPARAALGIFDTGASAVTFSGQDQEVFGMGDVGQIPIKVPGGASAEGIGGSIIGDVSEPGTIYSDGMHAFNLTFDDIGFPQFNITLSDSAVETPGIQAFVGTDNSPLLPTITGTPALLPSAKYSGGAAAHVKMQGASLDFSDLMPGMVIPFPDLVFANPGDSIAYDPNNTDIYDTVVLPLIPFGGDNSAAPGDLITETNLYTIPNVTTTFDTVTSLPGHFLFDTGAQLSVISTDMANSLGLDLSNPTTTIDVQGVAGNETVPGFTLKSLDIQRSDGGILEFTDVPVYVLDVAPGIDGIFGMNLLNLANEFVFDPYNVHGPQLSIAYFANPDRSVPVDDGLGELAALFGGAGLNALGGALGNVHRMPSFAAPRANSTTTLNVSNPTVEYGGSFTLNASVSHTTGTTIPSGTIDFSKNGQTFASQGLNAQGKATLTASGTPWEPGSYSVTAAYSGDSNYNSSVSTAGNIQIVKAGTSLSLQSPAQQVPPGQSLNLTGKLTTSTGIAAANATIQLKLDGSLSTSTTTGPDGSYAFTLANLSTGSHTVQTLFAENNHFKSATSGVVAFQVTKASSTLTLNVPQTAVYGQSVAITAQINQSLAAAYEGATVTFYDGVKSIGSAKITSGKASLNFNPGKPGIAMKLSAKVAETSQALAATSSISTLTVTKAQAKIIWSVATLNKSTSQWTIQVLPVSPGAGTPSGQLKITLGGAKPKTMTAKLSGGKYTYKVTGKNPAPKAFSYAGDTNFLSTSQNA